MNGRQRAALTAVRWCAVFENRILIFARRLRFVISAVRKEMQNALNDCGSFVSFKDCGGAIEVCPIRDGWLNIRIGRYCHFLDCSNFQNYDYTRNLRQSKKACSGARRREIGAVQATLDIPFVIACQDIQVTAALSALRI